MDKMVVTFRHKADTKRFVRFEADDEALGDLYMTKDAHEKLGRPEQVKATIEKA